MSAYEVRAEVSGSVWKVLKGVGEHVDAGDAIMIFESMKMEIPLLVEESGIIREVRVEEGAPVSEGDVVAVLQENG